MRQKAVFMHVARYITPAECSLHHHLLLLLGRCVCVWLLTFFFSCVDLLCLYCVCFFTLYFYFSLSLHCFVYFRFWRAVLANVCEHCNNNIESPAVDASLIARIFSFIIIFIFIDFEPCVLL